MTDESLGLCKWCAQPIPANLKPKRGPNPDYCKRACRQRAYEDRKAIRLTGDRHKRMVGGEDLSPCGFEIRKRDKVILRLKEQLRLSGITPFDEDKPPVEQECSETAVIDPDGFVTVRRD